MHTSNFVTPSLADQDAAHEKRWDSLLRQLQLIQRQHPDAVLASSLAAEDMVLTHAIFSLDLSLTVFTLDTGRLPAETLALMPRIQDRYRRKPAVFHPDPDALNEYVSQHGANAFYDSVALRKACCDVRKVAPLRRALEGRSAWITGQRREQSTTRSVLPAQEYDTFFGLEKFNPLADWLQADVWQAIRVFDIPYNPLHDQGYPSIGCDPCTRAIRPGEDERAGRWWWESSDSKECGLHAVNLLNKANTRSKQA